MTSAPDWWRLGARFAVADVCITFARPATVWRVEGDARRPLAERVVALREGPEGVSVQTACGLFLHVACASLGRATEDEADVEPRVRVVSKR